MDDIRKVKKITIDRGVVKTLIEHFAKDPEVIHLGVFYGSIKGDTLAMCDFEIFKKKYSEPSMVMIQREDHFKPITTICRRRDVLREKGHFIVLVFKPNCVKGGLKEFASRIFKQDIGFITVAFDLKGNFSDNLC